MAEVKRWQQLVLNAVWLLALLQRIAQDGKWMPNIAKWHKNTQFDHQQLSSALESRFLDTADRMQGCIVCGDRRHLHRIIIEPLATVRRDLLGLGLCLKVRVVVMVGVAVSTNVLLVLVWPGCYKLLQLKDMPGMTNSMQPPQPTVEYNIIRLPNLALWRCGMAQCDSAIMGLGRYDQPL